MVDCWAGAGAGGAGAVVEVAGKAPRRSVPNLAENERYDDNAGQVRLLKWSGRR